MTLDDLKKSPLKRGDFLFHTELSVVKYIGKVRNNPELIKVIYTGKGFIGGQSHDFKVKLADVSFHKKSNSRVGTKLILALCPACNLKIRVSATWLRSGTPRCFNRECPEIGVGRAGRELEIEWGTDGKGTLGADMKAQGKILQQDHHGREVDWSDMKEDV